MVDGGREEHEEHADDEEQHAHGPLPTDGNGWPHHPDAREGKDDSDKMCPVVGGFFPEKFWDVSHNLMFRKLRSRRLKAKG